MEEKITGGHGLAGINTLVNMACGKQKTGTCDGHELEKGSIEQTFGRLTTRTPPGEHPTKDQLRALAEAMEDNDETAEEGPAAAGMAFLGQFIDHDLTLDATTVLGKAAGDVTRIRNFRTPRLDLDCVYGGGREVSPHLYDGPCLIFGRRTDDVDKDKLGGHSSENPLDLQRNRLGRAIIGDPRNDENLFVSQVHGRLFIDRHNQIAAATDGSDEHKYDTARRSMVQWYHETIIDTLLPQIVDEGVLAPLVNEARQGFLSDTGRIDWRKAPDMPVEFSAAAYRFGHSMIRQRYDLNHHKGRQNVAIFAQPGSADAVNLKGFSPVDEQNNLQMDLFFGDKAQRSRPIDTNLPKALLKLPEEIVGTDEPNLAFRNMERGQITFELPTGERMANYMGIDPIEPDDRVKQAGLVDQTPLWYYILSEAEQHEGKLGPVGGTLVAGVILNLMLRGDSPAFQSPVFA